MPARRNGTVVDLLMQTEKRFPGLLKNTQMQGARQPEERGVLCVRTSSDEGGGQRSR